MWTIHELKTRALAAFKANYWPCVAVALIALVAIGGCRFEVKTSGNASASSPNMQARQGEAGDFSRLSPTPALPGEADAAVPPADASAETPPADPSAPVTFYGLLRHHTAIANNGAPGSAIGIVLFIVAALLVSAVVLLLRILLLNPLSVGCSNFFLLNTASKAGFDALGVPFRTWKRVVKSMFLRDLFLVLWALPGLLLSVGLTLRLLRNPVTESAMHSYLLGTLLAALLVLPAIVKLYAYRLVPYLLADDPSLSGRAAITRSRALMNGHKGHAFLLDLSFIGWLFLSLPTFGLLFVFYVNPYIQSAAAELYRALVPAPPSEPSAPVPPP